VQIIKSITAREVFKQMPEVKKQLWGGHFWSDGYFIITAGAHIPEEVIKQYIKNQVTSKETFNPGCFKTASVCRTGFIDKFR
jgi:putative transposase